MLIHEVTEFHLTELHTCCAEARKHLVPPHEGGEIELYEGSVATFVPMGYWSITTWSGVGLPIVHCPWCGERLPLPGEEADISGIDFDKVQDDAE
jgi:hypothetical protein